MASLLAFATRHYRRHAIVFAVAAPLLTVLILLAGWWWLFWPVMAWLFVYAVHFLVVKSLTVKDEWVEERTADTVDGAYDLDHIMSIRKRYDDKSAGNRSKTETPTEDKSADH